METLAYPDITLGEQSRQLYEEIACDYIRLDKHRGDDIDIILDMVNEMNGLVIADVGCGPGQHVKALLKVIPEKINKIIGLDFSENMLNYARRSVGSNKKVQFVRQNMLQMAIPDSCVDVVILMNNVLGNLIRNDISGAVAARRDGLRHCYRILRKGGICILSVFNLGKLDFEQDYYADALSLTMSLSSCECGDMVIQVTKARKQFHYYTHWFRESELTELLLETGFNISHVVMREKRMLVVCYKN